MTIQTPVGFLVGAFFPFLLLEQATTTYGMMDNMPWACIIKVGKGAILGHTWSENMKRNKVGPKVDHPDQISPVEPGSSQFDDIIIDPTPSDPIVNLTYLSLQLIRAKF